MKKQRGCGSMLLFAKVLQSGNRPAEHATLGNRSCSGKFRMYGQVLRTSEMGGFGSGGAKNGHVGIGVLPHFEEAVVFGARAFRIAIGTVDSGEPQV
jgi:hypothetical protein